MEFYPVLLNYFLFGLTHYLKKKEYIMKKDQKNMFHNIIISLIIVVMVLFLCEPVNAQDSNFPYSTMQDGYGQFLSSYWSAPGFMPGADFMISHVSPAPLEYYDSSWRDVSYWHNVGGYSTTWGDPVSYQGIDNDQYMAGAYFSTTSRDVFFGEESWWRLNFAIQSPVVVMEFSPDPSLTRDFDGKRTWNGEWLYPSTPNGSTRSLYQRPPEWPRY